MTKTFTEKLDETLLAYGGACVDKGSSYNNEFDQAQETIKDLILEEVIDAHITPSNYRKTQSAVKALRVEQRAIVKGENK